MHGICRTVLTEILKEKLNTVDQAKVVFNRTMGIANTFERAGGLAKNSATTLKGDMLSIGPYPKVNVLLQAQQARR